MTKTPEEVLVDKILDLFEAHNPKPAVVVPSVHEVHAVTRHKRENRECIGPIIKPMPGASLGYSEHSLPRYVPCSTEELVFERYITKSLLKRRV